MTAADLEEANKAKEEKKKQKDEKRKLQALTNDSNKNTVEVPKKKKVKTEKNNLINLLTAEERMNEFMSKFQH